MLWVFLKFEQLVSNSHGHLLPMEFKLFVVLLLEIHLGTR